MAGIQVVTYVYPMFVSGTNNVCPTSFLEISSVFVAKHEDKTEQKYFGDAATKQRIIGEFTFL